MIQEIIVATLFGIALFYLGRMTYRSFQSKSCGTGCGKCGAIDFAKIEREIKQRNL